MFRAVRPHHIADKSITKDKITKSCSYYMGLNVKNLNVWILGGGGWVAAMTAHLASQLSSHFNQYTCKIWKQSNKDILCYLENDEMSAGTNDD